MNAKMKISSQHIVWHEGYLPELIINCALPITDWMCQGKYIVLHSDPVYSGEWRVKTQALSNKHVKKRKFVQFFHARSHRRHTKKLFSEFCLDLCISTKLKQGPDSRETSAFVTSDKETRNL
jgi:hypothetical protein